MTNGRLGTLSTNPTTEKESKDIRRNVVEDDDGDGNEEPKMTADGDIHDGEMRGKLEEEERHVRPGEDHKLFLQQKCGRRSGR